MKERRTHRLLLSVFLLAFIVGVSACARFRQATPRHPPTTTQRVTPVPPTPVSPIVLPVIEGGRQTPSPSRPLSPQAHLPVIGQEGRSEASPTSHPVRVPSPTPPTPTPLPGPTASPQKTPFSTLHLPYMLAREAPVLQEPLPEEGVGPYVGLLLDVSDQAGEPLAGSPFTRWQMITRVLPDILATQSPPNSIVALAMGGNAACEENVHPLEVPGERAPDVRAFWTRVLASLSPRGVAPLAEGLLTLVSAFPETGRRPILLITSGSHFCGQDACAIARVLERAQSDVSIHVIALGGEEGEAQLRCLAERTGGTFHRVSHEEALRQAVKEALVHMRGGQLRVEVRGAAGRPFFPAVAVSHKDTLISEFDAWTDADLAAGTYSVTVGTPLPVLFPSVAITSGERTRLNVRLGELYLHLRDPQGRPVRGEMTVWAPAHGAFFSVVDENARIPLPTGHYTVSVRVPASDTPLAYARDVPIVVDSVQERALTLPVGYVDVTVERGGAPASAFLTLAPRVAPETPLVAGWIGGRMTFTLPEGVYRLTVRDYAQEGSLFRVEDVRVYAGETWPIRVDVGTGAFRVAPADRAGRALSGSVLIYPTGERTPVVAAGQVGERFSLPAGTYDVRVESEGTTLWAWDVSVMAGQEQQVTLTRPQARLWANVESTLPHPVAARLDVVRFEDGDIVASGFVPARWVLPPDTYVLRAYDYDAIGSVRESAPFFLDAGDAVTQQVSLPLAEVRIEPVDTDRVRVEVFTTEEPDIPLGIVQSYLPDFLLSPGTYNLLLVDEERPDTSRLLAGVTLTAGQVKHIRVRLTP